MKYAIRNYNHSDYDMIKSWWDDAKEPAPSKGLMPEESHFIFELDSIPVMSIGLFLTNSEVAFIENYIAAPNFHNMRSTVSQLMVNHVCNFATNLGYKRVCCFAYREKLVNRYQELGMHKNLENITSLGKELQ